MNKLTVVLSGKKQAGKNTACNLIVAKYINRITGKDDFRVDDKTGALIGPDLNFFDTNTQYKQVTNEFENFGVKVYSFADPLKKFIMDVFNVSYESCYGTDEQKNAVIPHLSWDNLPLGMKEPLEASWLRPLHGPMTGRELMQLFGTNICRAIYGDCWAIGTYNSIQRDGNELALVCDGRFPNEISLGSKVGAKTVRLLRNPFDDHHKSETALDDYPLSDFSLVIDNTHLNIRQSCEKLSHSVAEWFDAAGIVKA